jgi:hypothetical protein
MKNSKYKNYSDLTLDELEVLVQELENLSIVALKQNILKSVKEIIKEIEIRLKK